MTSHFSPFIHVERLSFSTGVFFLGGGGGGSGGASAATVRSSISRFAIYNMSIVCAVHHHCACAVMLHSNNMAKVTELKSKAPPTGSLIVQPYIYTRGNFATRLPREGL